MDAPDPPALVVIEMSDSETLRGTLIEEWTQDDSPMKRVFA